MAKRSERHRGWQYREQRWRVRDAAIQIARKNNEPEYVLVAAKLNEFGAIPKKKLKLQRDYVRQIESERPILRLVQLDAGDEFLEQEFDVVDTDNNTAKE